MIRVDYLMPQEAIRFTRWIFAHWEYPNICRGFRILGLEIEWVYPRGV